MGTTTTPRGPNEPLTSARAANDRPSDPPAGDATNNSRTLRRALSSVDGLSRRSIDRSIVQTYLYSWVVTSCVDEMQINKVTEWRGHRVAR
jgi:hypothetical protein